MSGHGKRTCLRGLAPRVLAMGVLLGSLGGGIWERWWACLVFAASAPPGVRALEERPSAVAAPGTPGDEWHRLWVGREYKAKGSVSVEGVVVDGEDRPVAGATVGFGPYGLLPFQWNCRTDSRGRFRLGMVLRDPAKSVNSIVGWAKGYAATRIPFPRPPGSYSVSIRLIAAKAVRVRLTDQDGAPVPNAFVVFVGRGAAAPHWPVQFRTNSDAEGRAEWDGLAGREVAVYAGRPGPVGRIGYRARATSFQCGEGEQRVTLERMPGEHDMTPPPGIEEVIACYIEADSGPEQSFPLFAPCRALGGNAYVWLSPQWPKQLPFAYFGCWFSHPLCYQELARLGPRLLQPRWPDAPREEDWTEESLHGLPELRRAPPPFDRANQADRRRE